MTRTWIATAVALLVHASMASAQAQHFTVSAPSASVYKAPTNVSPVLGQASQGATFEVTRDVGSWVKIAWSKSPDGVGYIRKAEGTMSVLGPAVPAAPAAKSTAVASEPVAPAVAVPSRTVAAQATPTVRRSQPTAVPQGYVAPTHSIGVGGQIGGVAMGGGFSVRGWSAKQHFGLQFDVMHYSTSNELFFTELSSTAWGPRVLYALRDHVSDQTWLRPYLGAGAHVVRSSMNDPLTGLPTTDTGVTTQLLGGTEVTLSSVPRLGLSAEIGYQWHQAMPFAGYDLSGATLALSAHWYLK